MALAVACPVKIFVGLAVEVDVELAVKLAVEIAVGAQAYQWQCGAVVPCNKT